MWTCSKCGAHVDDTSEVCHHCAAGKYLETRAARAAEPAGNRVAATPNECPAQPADEAIENRAAPMPRPGFLRRWSSRMIGLVLPMCLLAAFVAAMGYSWWAKRNHITRVQIAEFSPDGKTLATGSKDGTIRLWGAASGRYRGKTAAGLAGLSGLRFSPDGTTLAAVTGNGIGPSRVEIWDAATGRRRHSYDWETLVLSLDFSPDGRSLAIGGGFPLNTTFDRGYLRGDPQMACRLSLCDVTTGQERVLLKGVDAPIAGAKFLSDGQTLATWGLLSQGNVNMGFKVWDVTTGKDVAAFLVGSKHPVFLPNRKTAAVACDRAVKVWDLDKNLQRITLQGCPDSVLCAVFSPSGGVLATLGGVSYNYGDSPGEVKLWNPHTGEELHTLRTRRGEYPQAIAFSADSSTLAVLSAQTLQLWDIRTGREVFAVALWDKLRILWEGIEGFAVVGKTVMLKVRFPPEVKAFDIATGAEAPTPKDSPGQNDWATFAQPGSFQFGGLPSGPRWAHGPLSLKNDNYRRLIVRNKTTGEVKEIPGPWIAPVGFSDDGKSLVLATSEPSIQLYDLRTGKLKGVLGGVDGTRLQQLACSADGTTLAAVQSHSGEPTLIKVETSVKVWNLTTGRLQADLGRYWVPINGGALTADGRLLAVASYIPGKVTDLGLFAMREYESSEVKVWDTTTGGLRATLKGPERAQCHVAISPTSAVLATWSVTNFPEGGLWYVLGGFLADKRSKVAPAEVTLWDAATGRRIASLPIVWDVDVLLGCLATAAFFAVPGVRWYLWRRRKRKTRKGTPTVADIALC